MSHPDTPRLLTDEHRAHHLATSPWLAPGSGLHENPAAEGDR
jgi:hypothetical protein